MGHNENGIRKMKIEKMKIEKMKRTFEREKKALLLRPGIGRGTAVTQIRLTEGYRCEIEEGEWKLVVDMSEKHGGEGEGPNAGIIGRGALGSCLAIGYARWGAVLGIPLKRLEVEVQTDYDIRGEFGLADDVPPGYTGIRYVVRVESPAPEREVMRMLDRADLLSPYLDIFSNPHRIDRVVEYRQTAMPHQSVEEEYHES